MSCTNLSGNIGNCYSGIDLPYETGPQGADGTDGTNGVAIIENDWTQYYSSSTTDWETLTTVQIPADSLEDQGDMIQIDALFTVSVNSISTTLKLKWGSEDIVSFTYIPVDDKKVLITALISLSADTPAYVEKITGRVEVGDNPVSVFKTALTTLSGGTLVDPTSSSNLYIMSQKASAGSASDITLVNVTVKTLNA